MQKELENIAELELSSHEKDTYNKKKTRQKTLLDYASK